MPRATPLAPDERRAQVLDAALPLLRAHGRATTTKQVAEAAGVAEGTLFKVFGTKEELVEAACARVFDPTAFLADLEAAGRASRDRPLRERLVVMTTRLQGRLTGIFDFMIAMGVSGPPPGTRPGDGAGPAARTRVGEVMTTLLAPDADAFRLPVADVVRALRLLTFSGSHPHLADGHPLTPDEIVDLVLDGALRPGQEDR